MKLPPQQREMTTYSMENSACKDKVRWLFKIKFEENSLKISFYNFPPSQTIDFSDLSLSDFRLKVFNPHILDSRLLRLPRLLRLSRLLWLLRLPRLLWHLRLFRQLRLLRLLRLPTTYFRLQTFLQDSFKFLSVWCSRRSPFLKGQTEASYVMQIWVSEKKDRNPN